MIPYTSDVHDAPATPINPVVRSRTITDHVAEADAGRHGLSRAAATRARLATISIGSPVLVEVTGT
jgi:hypothetical protein